MRIDASPLDRQDARQFFWGDLDVNIDISMHDLASTESYAKIRELLERALAETLTKVAATQSVEGLMRQALSTRVSPVASAEPAPAPRLPITEREYQVLRQIAAGASNKEIARSLNLSLHTVKRHVANILSKLKVDSRVEAAMLLYARH